jgi:hypothetical protein
VFRTEVLEGDYPRIGNYLSGEDIPVLVEMLVDNFLGAWVNQRIICVGDYSSNLPSGYQSGSKILYNSNYMELLSPSNCFNQFLRILESDGPDIAESNGPKIAVVFKEEYDRLLEECFPSNRQHVLLNLTSREYVLGGSDIRVRDTESWSLRDAAMSYIC